MYLQKANKRLNFLLFFIDNEVKYVYALLFCDYCQQNS